MLTRQAHVNLLILEMRKRELKHMEELMARLKSHKSTVLLAEVRKKAHKLEEEVKSLESQVQVT